MVLLPEGTPEAAAERRRLYTPWPNAQAVSERLGVEEGKVTAMRRRREVLAVWVQELEEYRFPTFQFHGGQAMPEMPELLTVLSDPTGSGWGWVEWFISCRALLDGGCPIDYLAAGRAVEVLAVAREEASEAPKARW